MADTNWQEGGYYTGSNTPPPVKMVDNGDGTYAIHATASIDSARVSCTSYSNGTFATLVGSVNTHLAGSSSYHLNTLFFSDGLVTPTFYAVVIEHS